MEEAQFLLQDGQWKVTGETVKVVEKDGLADTYIVSVKCTSVVPMDDFNDTVEMDYGLIIDEKTGGIKEIFDAYDKSK